MILALSAAALVMAFLATWLPFEATVVWLLYFLVLQLARIERDRG